MKKVRLHHLVILSLLGLFACSPRFTIAHLSPQPTTDQQYTSALNTKKVILEKEDVRLECDYLQSTAFDLVFQLNIYNYTDSSITINPTDYEFVAIDQKGYDYADVQAYDPDELVAEIDHSIEMDQRALRTEKGLGWLAAGLSAIAATASFANDEEEVGTAYAIDAAVTFVSSTVRQSRIRKNLGNLSSERDFFKNATIKACEIAPGEMVEGIIVFPRLDDADQLDVVYPIANRVFTIRYQQQIYKSKR